MKSTLFWKIYSYTTGYCLPYFHPFPFTYGCEIHQDELKKNKAQLGSMSSSAHLGNGLTKSDGWQHLD